LDSIRRSLFHEYVELIMDEEDFVREAALANIVKLTEFIDDSTKSNIIVPIWRKLCTEKPARLLELMARDFGAFLYNTKNVLSEADVKFFVEFYHFMVFSQEEDLRIWSAYNFPGVLKTVGPEFYEAFKLDQVLSHLSMDIVIEVKRRLACGFHEVVELLDKQSQFLLRNIFLRLLSDSEVDVYEPLFANLNLILRGFALDESGRKTAQFDELLFSILRKEREYASNASYKLSWRIHHALLQQFKFFIDYFDSEYIHDQCVPLLFKLLSDNVTVPIKQTIIETLCIYLRKMRRLENRIKIIRNITDLRESPNYHTRLLFMWTLTSLYTHFSHHFLRETFFDEFLEMARDTVPNIRLAFVTLSHAFRKSLIRGFQTLLQLQQQQHPQQQFNMSGGGGGSLPFTQYLQQQQQQSSPPSTSTAKPSISPQHQAALTSNITRLNECLMSLCGDPDRDVATAAQDELERLGGGGGIRRGNAAQSNGKSHSLLDEMMDSIRISESEAMIDREREDHEDRLLSIEIEEDTSVMRKREDDLGGAGGGVSGNRGAGGKRMSIVKHNIAGLGNAVAGGGGAGGAGVGGGGGGGTKTNAGNVGGGGTGAGGGGVGGRRSVSSKTPAAVVAKTTGVGGTANSSASSSFASQNGGGAGSIMNPRSMGLANRVVANHGSLTQLSNSMGGGGNGGAVTSLPPEGLKRGKSAGPIGKTKASAVGGANVAKPEGGGRSPLMRSTFNDEPSYSLTSELAQSGKKKSLMSLTPSPVPTKPLGLKTVGAGGSALTKKDYYPTSSRANANSSSSGQGVIGMRSLASNGGSAHQPRANSGIKQLPPIPLNLK
ncbi:Serine/threonine-protein phosphatase 4 regulatory subunit 4, partial [Podochytrium sp. JEL0797]